MTDIDLLDHLDPPCPRGCGRTIDDCNEAEDEGDCAGSELVQELESKVERLASELATARDRVAQWRRIGEAAVAELERFRRGKP